MTLFRAATNTFPIHDDLLIGFAEETSQCYGNQRFEYAVYLGKQNITMEQVIAESRKYTIPLISAELGAGTGGTLPQELSFLKKNNNNVIISCVKRCENEENALLIRLYNPVGISQTEKLDFSVSVVSADITDMKETTIAPALVDGKQITLELGAFQIVTLKVRLK